MSLDAQLKKKFHDAATHLVLKISSELLSLRLIELITLGLTRLTPGGFIIRLKTLCFRNDSYSTSFEAFHFAHLARQVALDLTPT